MTPLELHCWRHAEQQRLGPESLADWRKRLQRRTAPLHQRFGQSLKQWLKQPLNLRRNPGPMLMSDPNWLPPRLLNAVPWAARVELVISRDLATGSPGAPFRRMPGPDRSGAGP